MEIIEPNLELRKEKIEQDVRLLRTWAAGLIKDEGRLAPLIEMIEKGMIEIQYYSTTRGPVLLATSYGKAVLQAMKEREGNYEQ